MIDKKKIKGAFKWQVLNISTQAILQFAFIMISARVLPKEVHGAFAILYALVFVMTISSEGGVSSALIQRKEVNPKHVSIAFYLTLLLSVTFFLLLTLFSHRIVLFYDEKITENQIFCASLIFVIMALGKVSEAFLIKNFNFKKIFISKNISFFLGNIVVMYIVARFNGGIYALIWGYVATQLFTSILYYSFARHSLRPSFANKEFKELFYFGSSFTLLRIVNYLSSQVDKLLLGKYFSITSLSVYEKGQFLSKMPPKYIGNSIDSIMFSAFAKIELVETKKNYFATITSWIFLITIYFGIVFYFNAQLIIDVILGESWSEVQPYLELLSLTIPALLFARLGDVLVRSENKMFKSIPIKIIFLLSLVTSIYLMKDMELYNVSIAIVACYWLHGVLMLILSTNLLRIYPQLILTKMIGPVLIGIILYAKYWFLHNSINISSLWMMLLHLISDTLVISLIYYKFKAHPKLQPIKLIISAFLGKRE